MSDLTAINSAQIADPFFRPQAKDLDMSLMELSVRDAEPVVAKEEFTPTVDMFDALFPKHIAEALKHGQKVRVLEEVMLLYWVNCRLQRHC